MTDNFERYREYIEICGGLPDNNEHGNLDKYYCIELMRRGKDNPDLPAANYHFRNYYIYSWRDLDKKEQEIKDICTLLRLRAYASVNYKLMSQVALDTLAESARRVAAHDYKKFYNIFESCSGKFEPTKDSKWVVDVDDEDMGLVDSTIYLHKLEEFINSMRSGHSPNIIYTMPTKSGWHYITHPFHLAQFQKEFRVVFNYNEGIQMPTIKKNHLTLLYENL